ncbi:MAG TPA: hypothetical protein PLL30_03665 [Candidatus Krumholzibacteria bacterium]|nr:hypothetical protein [Candidatus Krumholzibacteria bacterium]HPD70871.1 hypothetical protein [Candidatus Krumholzibacteria bacterium]HRY39429.1 hypothetical protein [Candidatus Krumholzibacteria bacterium]
MITSSLAVLGPFEAIPYVGTPLALIAFVVAVAASVYRARLAERRKLIETAPAEQRGELMVAAIRDFSTVPLENLTKEQRFQLALRLIEERQARFRVTTIVAVTVAAALAVAVLVAGRGEASTNLVVRLHGPGGEVEIVDEGLVVLDAGGLRLESAVGPDGQARFENLPENAYEHGVTILASAPGLEPVAPMTLREAPAGGAVYVAMRPQSTVLRGTVLAADTSRTPLADVVVNVDSGAACDTTDAQGNFRLVVARAPGTRVPLQLVRDGELGFDDAVTLAAEPALVLRFDPGDER